MRMKRKRFKPRKAIRSQPAPMRVTQIQEKQGKQAEQPAKDEELEQHKEQIMRSRIFSDVKFFQTIGIPPDKIKSWTHSLAVENVMDLKDETD